MKKKILIAGGKSKSLALSDSLNSKGYSVTVVNKNKEDCRLLSENHDINIIHGDATKPYILQEADTSEMDVVISLIPNDEENLVVCQLAKKMFKVDKTIALLSDSRKIEFFKEMGIDKVICSISIISDILEHQAVVDTISKYIPLSEGAIEIVEIPVYIKDKAYNKKVWELGLPSGAIISCIIRNKETIIPNGDTIIDARDVLVLLSKKEYMEDAVKMLKED